jgi:two-component system, OmpR family, sensor histidine kinase VanS
MFKSIKARLTVTICGILLIIFTIQMAANFLFAEQYYVYQKTKMMKNVNQQIIHEAKSTDEDMSQIIKNLDIDNNLDIIITDDKFTPIYTFHSMGAPMMNPQMIKPDFDFSKYPKELYVTEKPTIIMTNMQDGDRIRLLSKIEHGGESYYMVIRLSVKSISTDMKSTNMFILYISSFAVIIGCMIVYFITKQLSRPIEDINNVTVHISKLDFSLRSKDIERKDEIGSLARNINNMSLRLEENILSLTEANRKLEIDYKYMSELDEQRKELIANISHELKTPLAILTGYSEILSNDIPGIDKTFYYETIQDEAHKMDILIKNLLNLSDFENRLFQLNMEEINLEELIEKIFRKNTLLMKNKDIVGEYHSEPCKTVIADPMYIEVAVNNYISNAISYTKKGHKIIIKVEPVEEEAVISVFNEGPNINETNIDKIWNSFYREDKARRRTSQNNIGLGLYIVQSIINAHHGKCGVLNKENGVEFWISLNTVTVQPCKDNDNTLERINT